ncbi:MAG: hypothetical protein V3T72_19850 [Thermoanaerobaculia bacterium]
MIEKAGRLGAKLSHFEASLMGPRGPTEIRFLERDGHPSEPLPENDEDRVGWDTLRRWCNQLRIDPRDLDIGLDLG